jgi:hypothetical protein
MPNGGDRGAKKRNNMIKFFSLMLVMASMVFVFSSCSEDEKKKEYNEIQSSVLAAAKRGYVDDIDHELSRKRAEYGFLTKEDYFEELGIER